MNIHSGIATIAIFIVILFAAIFTTLVMLTIRALLKYIKSKDVRDFC